MIAEKLYLIALGIILALCAGYSVNKIPKCKTNSGMLLWSVISAFSLLFCLLFLGGGLFALFVVP